MKTTRTLRKRIISLLLAVAVFAATLPSIIIPAGAEDTADKIIYGDRTADISTMDSWKDLFPADNTSQAGRIWTDKSVFTDASAFTGLKDANGNPVTITMDDADNNFLVALSALASNKSIVGYSYTPTDTMLVLDASGSMSQSNYVDDLVTAANNAIEELLTLNKHNRVGVVLYSGKATAGNSAGSTATVLLPLDRYTHSSNKFLVNNGQSSISVNSGVKNKAGSTMPTTQKNVSGGTYIQNGVYMAMEELLAADTIIPDGEHQAGTTRTPIFVLMSDGRPTAATNNYYGTSGNNVTGIGTSNLGDGTEPEDVLDDVIDFANQLTAAYAKYKVDVHYAATTPLFYTLGLGANNQNLNSAVLDPSNHNNTDSHWKQYLDTANGSSLILPIEETRTNKKGQDITETTSFTKISEISKAEQQNYVTEHFTANNAAGLIAAFKKIVNQIIIQSLYYPTLVQDGNFDHDGFVEFIDDIGHYMEVKDIKGIMVGDTLFTGEILAKKFTDNDDNAFYDEDGNPTELANNMVWSVMERIGIDDAAVARDLITSAHESGQLKYNSQTGEWSNYIGWYADDAGNFLGHWNDTHTAADAPQNAAYINKSYGMLGEVTDEHTATDLMYISTQVHTRISDGNVSFIWSIPSSLVPVVSYNVTLNGENIENSTSASIEYDVEEPIRIVFEVGLIDNINPANVTEMVTDTTEHIIDENGDGIADDGKYYFYTNWWNDDKLSHENPPKVHDTIVFFEPSLQNERYYYNEETAVFIKSGDTYVKYKGDMPKAGDGNTYYREYVVFEGTNIVKYYEVMSDATIGVLKAENQNSDTTWDVPAGTVHRILEPYNLEKEDKTLTETIPYVRYPVIEQIPQKDSFYVGEILGNNGRIAMEIPQGIKISKSVDNTLYGTDDTYTFTVTSNGLSGEYKAYTQDAEGNLTLDTVTFQSGTATVSIKAGEAIYIVDLPYDANYTVTEVINGKYAVKSLTVNGVAQSGVIANFTVEQQKLTDVKFENTLVVNTGTMVVSKEIVYDSNISYNDDQTYTFEWYNVNDPENKKTFTIKASETEIISGLNPGDYIVNEINIPAGYTPKNNNIKVTVPDTAASVVPVHFVNDYVPKDVKPVGIEVSGTKTLSGRDWREGDSFTFKLQQLQGANWVDLAQRTVAYGDADYSYKFDFTNDAELKDLALSSVGNHRFRVIEVIPETKLGGVTYDEVYHYFDVIVTDETMDGYLEVKEVTALSPATATQSGSVWNVDADFTNTYAATAGDNLVITIDKTVTDKVGASTGKDGFTFGLYTEGGTNPIVVSGPTDKDGKAEINLTFPASSAGKEYAFEIREIVPEDKVNGMIYVEEPYKINIKVIDNFDGTVTAVIVTPEEEVEGITVDFENVYDPADAVVTLEGTKVMEGRDFAANEFTFELYKDGETTPKLATNDSKASGGGFKFEDLTFDAIGTYGYTIKERKGTLGGVSYSGKSYDVEITVSDDADNDGVLDYIVKIDGNTVTGSTKNTVVFTNIYTAEDVDVTLEATKTLTGRALKDGEFKFDLYNANSSFVKGTIAQNDVALKLNGNNGKITFTALNFDTAGDYYYVMVEDAEDVNGITADKSEKKIRINVTDNNQGKLVATVYVNGTLNGEIVFANTYKAESVKVGFTGTKTIEGRELSDGEFKFDLYSADASFNKDAVVENDVALVLQTDGSGKITFSDITFDTVGTYYYVIVEDEVDENGVTMDKSEYKISVTVTDPGMGKLAAAVKVNGTDISGDTAEAVKFKNIYKANEVKVALVATKTLTGRALKDGEFKFDLYNADKDYTKGTTAEDNIALVLQPDGTGRITFKELSFDKVGTYYYVIIEDELDEKGITADKTRYKVKIDVTDNGLGQLLAKVYVNDAEVTGDIAETVKFENLYEIAPTTIKIEGQKVLNGRTLQKGEFTFELYDKNGKLIGTAHNDADGKIAFDGIEITQAGEYTYTVKEVKGSAEGITYDTAVFTVKVTVTDNGDGTFKVEYEYQKGEEKADVIAFNNTYTPPATPNTPATPTSPVTGEKANMGLLLALMFVMGGVFCVILRRFRKVNA